MKPSLQSRLKALAARIHRNQIPLDRRESQKLLNVLNSSFRKQLDQVHPGYEAANTSNEISVDTPSSTTETKSLVRAHSSRASTISLIENILCSPLFAPGVKTISPIASRDKFQVAVAIGQANIDLAGKFLHQHIGIYTSGWNERSKLSIRQSKAATGVMHWLWSSGTIDSASFYRDVQLHRMLVAGLVAEDRFNLIKTLLSSLPANLVEAALEKDSSEVPRLLRDMITMKKNIVNAYVDAALSFQVDINERLAGFQQLVQEFHSHPQSMYPLERAFSNGKEGLVQKVFARAGLVLTREAIEPEAGVLPETYDAWLGGLRQWSPRANLRAYCASLLKLHHPLRPNFMPAVHYLSRIFSSKALLDRLSSSNRRDILDLGIKTASVLVSHHKIRDARQLLRDIEDSLPELLPNKENVSNFGESDLMRCRSKLVEIHAFLSSTRLAPD